MSDKIIYVTKADSIVGTSFQTILAAPYGKVITGSFDVDVIAQVILPGLSTFQKQDVRDGRSGRKYWIKDESRKTKAQLKNWIWNQLTGITQVLTRNILHYLHTMLYALYTFIRTSYKDTTHSGKFDSTPA